MKLLDGFSRAGAVRSTGVLVASTAVAACCLGVSSAAAAGVIRTINVGSDPQGVSSDGTHVWVANASENTVSEIEASSGTVIHTIGVGSEPIAVSSDGTHVWVANIGEGTVSEIQASSATVVHTISVGSGPDGVSSDGTHVWVANINEGTVSEIQASSATVIHTINVQSEPEGVSSDGTHVWVANHASLSVSEIEASSATVIDTIPVVAAPVGVSSDGTHVWVTTGNGEVSEIEASSAALIRTVPVGSSPTGVSSDGTHVWVANVEGTVSEIEASSATVIHTIGVGSGPVGVSSDGTHVWVANASEATVSEILPNGVGLECTGNSGTVKLSPGLSGTPAIQTVKIKGTLSGCTGEPFTAVAYKATLKTAAAVSCSVLSAAGERASGAAKYKWTPKAKSSKGTLSLLLTETPGVAFSGEVTSGTYSPLRFSGTATERYSGAATCSTKAVKKATFSGSAVGFF